MLDIDMKYGTVFCDMEFFHKEFLLAISKNFNTKEKRVLTKNPNNLKRNPKSFKWETEMHE